MGGVLLSLGDFRAPPLSLSVVRDDVGLDDEFELFMQLPVTPHDIVATVPVFCARSPV
jgi:hypothetical protein